MSQEDKIELFIEKLNRSEIHEMLDEVALHQMSTEEWYHTPWADDLRKRVAGR